MYVLKRDQHLVPNWASNAALDILRIGYSDRFVPQLMPDMLRIAATVPVHGLAPSAALYLREQSSETAALAGCYNLDWTMLETTVPCGGSTVYGERDPRSGLFTAAVPITRDMEETCGVLRLYRTDPRPFDAAEDEALGYIARHIELVIHRRLAQDGSRKGPLQRAIGHKAQRKVFDILAATVENFPGGLCAIEPDLTVSMTNRRFYELLALPEERFPPGVNFADILRFNALRGEYGSGDVDELVATRVRHARLFLEHSFERETLAGVVVEARTAPVPGGGCILIYVDVTARKKAERDLMQHRDTLEEIVRCRTAELASQAEELERMLAQERQINELQRQFVAMTSHEFRTPLAIIDGAAQRLVRRKDGATPEFVADKADQIRSSVSRMLELMESILAAGRLDHGRLTITHGDCSLSDIIATCCSRQARIKKSHRFLRDLDRLPPSMSADRTALEQVFDNLLSNAVKYAPDAPNVHITGWQERDWAYVSVRDEGIGIDQDDLPRMFQRYFRARTSTGIAGTGIGLNFVKQIVEMHGGAIEVTSSRGQGTTFTVALPIAATQGSSDQFHTIKTA
ncbi:PAS-domain containing protein [Rhizobium sp. TRM95111]|uniref:sensor histidine kinase n=1 Tax=Rhizobium alarense TaxID=2846851 RepID=UPI001F34F9DB|nr:ATP-binding protein [Rhizobium alarense]MCF3639599.1 PAS-domain containing protein [Rhizobium alarense]